MRKIQGNREELELFKTQINIAEVAEDMGYEIDKRKSTRKSIVLKAGGDVIIVSRNADNGHYIYFNPENPRRDSGTIIDFIQNRTNKNLGQVRKLLRQYLQSGNRIQHLEKSSQSYVKSYYQILDKFDKAWNKYKQNNDEYFMSETRGVSEKTLRSTEYLAYYNSNDPTGKGDRYVFPIFCENGICGLYLTDTQMKDKKFAKDSIKGIWADKQLKKLKGKENIKIIVTESPIDNLSLKELGLNDENTLHIATLGRMGQEAKDTLAKIFKLFNNAELVIATDNDEAGQQIADDIVKIAEKVEFKGNIERMTFGQYKDANEYLQAKKERARATRAIEQEHSRGIKR